MELRDKHVMVVTSVYPLTAKERYGSFVQETIARLGQTGAKFTVFAPAYKGCEHQVVEGIKVYRFRYCLKQYEDLTHGEGAPNKIQNHFYKVLAAFYILAGTWQLFWLCFQERPDLLHIHWPFPHGLMAWPTSRLLKIPMVFSFHGAELLLARKFGFVRNVLQWLLPQADSITANSSFTSSLIGELSKVPIEVIPYGLTVKAKPSPRRDEEVQSLLFVGRLIQRKGVKYLLQALPIVTAKQFVRLRIIGEGPLKEELKTQCKSLGIDDIVDFLGFVNDEELRDEYAACDIFVLPSTVDDKGDTEGLGIVAIEASAHAKPVVASAVGGLVDVIRPEITGLLVPEKNPQVLAEAILALLSNSESAERMGYAGLDYVQEHFSWSRIVPLWRSVFVQSLNGCSLH